MFNSTSKNFLKPVSLAVTQTRDAMINLAPVSDLDPQISLESPLEDYERLMNTNVQSEDIEDDDVMRSNYIKISKAARDIIWQLLFGSRSVTKDEQTKIADFMSKVKEDACFQDPFAYNEWINGVRDELLKRQMLDFWREHVVEKELGPCWARDSDYFDDMEDPAPTAFYNYAGCVAPFGQVTGERHNSAIAELPQSAIGHRLNLEADFEANISTDTPAEDYDNLINIKVRAEQLVEDDVITRNFNKIAIVARDAVWKLLFSDQPASVENQIKAGDLLYKLKADACFYDPWSYNKWINSVRDELLKRGMLDFWRDQIVAKELGPCWARDSDFFDDMDDTEPADFYNRAGCVATFSKADNYKLTSKG
ncbi:uncharacterized protein LOC118735335 isoform X1 [Rhagoletis pomonella]|uniref:uncharacterized protein LOC118735335 isoform X1 n=2 Tax=Rhagoletis pomonella TaxID=28610 RepID=UPI00177E77AC|nr:uncharacterized protein LOC118735335 isoform X1 [Rhagoletis pomonella]